VHPPDESGEAPRSVQPLNGTSVALVDASDAGEDYWIPPLTADDLAAFVRPADVGRDLHHVWFDVRPADITDEIREWARKVTAAVADEEPCEAMRYVVDKWLEVGGREGQLRGTLAAIGREYEGGHRGLVRGLDELWSLREKEPRGFQRMLEGARAKVLKNNKGRPPAPACTCGVSLAGSSTAEGAADVSDGAEDVGEDILSSWVPKDLHAVWDNAGARKVPEVLHRVDGHAMFYPGHTHSVHGESESGKSWVALVAAVEVLSTGGWVWYLDYESDEFDVVGRMRALGMVLVRAGCQAESAS
jgi:hypothetical protein